MADTIDRASRQLASALGAALGDNLVSLMLYGSAARGTWVEGRSDINVLLVVKDASAPTLLRAAPALGDWLQVAQFIKTPNGMGVDPEFIPECMYLTSHATLYGIRGEIRGLAAEALEARALSSPKVQEHTRGKTVRKVIVVPRKLVNIVVS